jgi:hypothetical protein
MSSSTSGQRRQVVRCGRRRAPDFVGGHHLRDKPHGAVGAPRRQLRVDGDAVADGKLGLVAIGHCHRQVFAFDAATGAQPQVAGEDRRVIDGADFQFGLKDPR